MTKSQAVQLAGTHLAAAAGGCAAAAIGVPLPWMTGALVVIACATMARLPTRTARSIRDGGMIVMLKAIGLTFTPVAGAAVLSALPLMITAALATVVIGIVLGLLLSSTAGIDRVTAYFCAIPGGPAEMGALGERHGANPAMIGMSQLLRIVLLVLIIPPFLTFGGFKGDAAGPATIVSVNHAGLAATLVLALLPSLVMSRLGMRTAFVLVPMAVGMALGLTEARLSSIPPWLSNSAQVLLGAYLGAQFQQHSLRAMRRLLPAAILNMVLLMLTCASFGVGLALLSGVSAANMVLATAPGSVTEMAITAKVLGLEVPLVTAFHVLRIFIVIALTPWSFALLQRVGVMDPVLSQKGEPAE
jgi:hypothetical protein